ncbi:hypothetical protein [Enterobacter sp. DTU_2021_1002640_1_SI_PRY_ASU_LCPMC_013]|uniref:hypothetical protein n=1 Tax=Enterobacter sp. DTU_2021_1002640_1_SI_PRY_ASU_LCPMC_013 TaxID=3077940 RepID=UPI00397749E4
MSHQGGESYRLNEMAASDIAELYVNLFKLHFAGRVRCYDKSKIQEILSALPHMVFGNALFYKSAPCIDLLLYSGNEDTLYFNDPNGGLDPASVSSVRLAC